VVLVPFNGDSKSSFFWGPEFGNEAVPNIIHSLEDFEMTIPSNVDAEAIRLLDEADWPWSDLEKAFVKSRNPDRETTGEYLQRSSNRISYAELKDHSLVGSESTEAREAGIRWLRGKLSACSR